MLNEILVRNDRRQDPLDRLSRPRPATRHATVPLTGARGRPTGARACATSGSARLPRPGGSRARPDLLPRDANGHLVLSSNRPRGRGPMSYLPGPKGRVGSRHDPPSRAQRPYDDVIAEHARPSGVRPDLVRAVVQVESGFNPNARSPKGAMGLMQLMPATAQQFGVKIRSTRWRTSAPACVPARSCSIATTTTKRSRSRPTMPVQAPSTGTARTCRRIARRRTT